MQIADTFLPTFDRKTLLYAALLFIGYIVGTQLSYFFYTAPAVFPIQSGVALAGLVLCGIRLWPAIFLAALVIYSANGSEPLLAFTFAIGNTLQAIVGAYILRAFNFNPHLSGMRDIFALMLVAVFASTIVPTVGLLGYAIRESLGGNGLSIPWAAWWIGHILSLLIVAPFLIRWLAKPYIPENLKEIIEAGFAFVLLFALTCTIWILDISHVANVPLVYAWLIPFFWIALRLSPALMTLALTSVTILSLLGTALPAVGATPSPLPVGVQLYLAEIFIEVIAVIFLILTAVVEERRQANFALEQQIQKLEDALNKIRQEDQSKNEFIATLAHELRNPLAPVVSTLELLKIEEQKPDTYRLIKNAEDQIYIMRRLLDDLLDVVRVTQKRFELQKERVTLQSTIVRSLHTVEAFMASQRHNLSVSTPAEPIWIYSDSVRIAQIFTNILYNAAKYTEPGGEIAVTAQREGDEAVVTIQDSGIGIEPGRLASIFEPFVHGKSLRPPVGTGLGVGLSITKQLVEMHSGTIEAHSEGIDRGSTFIVRLPLDRDQSTFQSALEPQGPSNATYKILIVDDNQVAAESLQKLLSLKGHRVAIANTGAGALTAVSTLKPDIVLLDLGLPDIDGYDVARELRKQKDTPYIIALTGFGQDSDKTKTLINGFHYHLTKPVTLEDLENALNTLPTPIDPNE